MPAEYDPDVAYESIQAAIENGAWLELSNLVAELKAWTFTDSAKEYGRNAIEMLRSYCDCTLLAYGHRATLAEQNA